MSQNLDQPWYEMALIKTLPLPHRLYAWWVKNGFKRANGFVWGGNKAFGLIRSLYKLLPSNDDNYVSIPAYDDKFLMAVDLRDFEVPHHTLPLSCGTGSEAKLLELLFPIGGTFFDIGANYGFFSLLACYLGGEDAVVCAFEPQPRLAQALEISKGENRFEQLRVNKIALGKKQGEIAFFIPDTGSGVASVIREHAGNFSRVVESQVTMETFDAFFQSADLKRLDMVKIDVEGAEFDVLEGGSTTIKEYQPLIWFEMNPDAQEMAGRDQDEIYLFLESLGYKKFYDIDDVAKGVIDPIRFVSRLTNVLAIPEAKTEILSGALARRN